MCLNCQLVAPLILEVSSGEVLCGCMYNACNDASVSAVGVASYGHWGTCPPQLTTI